MMSKFKAKVANWVCEREGRIHFMQKWKEGICWDEHKLSANPTLNGCVLTHKTFLIM